MTNCFQARSYNYRTREFVISHPVAFRYVIGLFFRNNCRRLNMMAIDIYQFVGERLQQLCQFFLIKMVSVYA